VKAKDAYDAESDWSDPLSVTMPVNQRDSQNSQQSSSLFFFKILERLLLNLQ